MEVGQAFSYVYGNSVTYTIDYQPDRVPLTSPDRHGRYLYLRVPYVELSKTYLF